jgi:ABC-type multidrug transport system fused ATPase/permease subunit
LYYKTFSNKLLKLGYEKQLHETEKFKKVNQGLSGIREVKLHNVTNSFIKVFDKHNIASIYSAKIQHTINLAPRILLELMAVFGVVILVAIMIFVEKRNPSDIIPTIAIFAAAAFRITPSINKLIVYFQSIRFGTASVDILKKLNFKKIPIKNASKIKPFPFVRDIKLTNISFKYPNRNDYVDNLKSSRPKHENLQDLELGFRSVKGSIPWEVNGFYMKYKNLRYINYSIIYICSVYLLSTTSFLSYHSSYLFSSTFLKTFSILRMGDKRTNKYSNWSCQKSATG